MRRTGKSWGGNPFLFICFLVVAAIFGALILEKYRDRHEVAVPPAGTPPGVSVPVTLFFSSADGTVLVGETRKIDRCPAVEECVSRLVAELASGPLGDLGPTLPAATVVRRVTVEEDVAVIDFGGAFRDALPAGSSAELMAVYSVVDTVTKNFPEIGKVRFLVEGRGIDTLKGHLDLREPVGPDYTLVGKPPAGE